MSGQNSSLNLYRSLKYGQIASIDSPLEQFAQLDLCIRTGVKRILDLQAVWAD